MEPFTVQKTLSHKNLMEEFEDNYDFNSAIAFQEFGRPFGVQSLSKLTKN